MANYKQTYGNSCGAVALMCAASELGINALPNAGKWSFLESSTPLVGNTSKVNKALLGWNGQPITGGIVNGSTTIENAIYAVTSGDMESYSMPSRVIACAKHMGLNVSMYVDSGFYAGALKLWYPNELEACKAQGIKINEGKSPGPTGKQRELEIFSTMIVGLHYVLRRPATETKVYMDPADGTNYVNASAMNSTLKMYKTTGVSIILSRDSGTA